MPRKSRQALCGLPFVLLATGMTAWAQPPSEGNSTPAPPDPQVPPTLSAPRTDQKPEATETAPTAQPAPADEVTVPEVAPPDRARVYAPHEPPPPVAERRSRQRPGPGAIWTPGYWEWDTDDGRFVWVAGSWQVPPSGMVWQPSRWVHEARGWYFVSGTWARPTDLAPSVATARPAWRTTGPPADHPDDIPPPAPGPNFFYVPGHYAPDRDGDRLAWVPGFWAAVQPGWDWLPARWVRRGDGWDYRSGQWVRESDSVVVERLSPRDRQRLRRLGAATEVITRDPITGAEVDVIPPGEPVPVGAVGAGMPYYMIRPPGGMYGPGGVVVPDAVPPFVRRMLDRVLP